MIDDLETMLPPLFGDPQHQPNMRGRHPNTHKALARLREMARAKGQKTVIGRSDPKRADTRLRKF